MNNYTITVPSTNNYQWYDNNTWPQYQYWTTFPTTIYKYQVKCPECETMNWLEIDKMEKCVKKTCKANLKAVSNKADHEIEVVE